MKIDKNILIELVDDEEVDGYTKISDEFIERQRWSLLNRLIFQDDATKKYYESYYSSGSTEYQDEAPYEYEGDVVEVFEVEPVAIVTVEYKRKDV